MVVEQVGGSNPKPAQRFQKEAFLFWAARLKQKSGAEVYAVYEACGFGFSLQRKLSALSIKIERANKKASTEFLVSDAVLHDDSGKRNAWFHPFTQGFPSGSLTCRTVLPAVTAPHKPDCMGGCVLQFA